MRRAWGTTLLRLSCGSALLTSQLSITIWMLKMRRSASRYWRELLIMQASIWKEPKSGLSISILRSLKIILASWACFAIWVSGHLWSVTRKLRESMSTIFLCNFFLFFDLDILTSWILCLIRLLRTFKEKIFQSLTSTS